MNVTEEMVEALKYIVDDFEALSDDDPRQTGSARIIADARAAIAALSAATALSQADGTQEPSIWWKTDVNGRMNNATDDPFCASVWREQGYILKEGFTRPREQEGAEDDRDAVLAAVLHEFGPDGCAKVLARLPEAKDYVKALRKRAHPLPAASFHAGAEDWNYDMNAAPRDGTDILTVCKVDSYVSICAYRNRNGDDMWIDGIGEYPQSDFYAWMPRPTPPPLPIPASSEGR